MKKFITALTFLFSMLFVSAQEKSGKITGQVTDHESKPLEGATVQLLKADNKSLIKVSVTNKTGNFEMEKLASGKYILSVTAVGHALLTTAVELNGKDLNVPAIRLQQSSKELGGVTVVGKRPLVEQKIDRTVINVEAAPTNAGASALEVLEKSPGISVSNDGAISLKGKQGVIVMMDGKQTYLSATDLANLLRNLPASALDQIEIMTNPPAKYDASGNSGIINIKTKKSRNDGFNGSITQGGTVSLYERNGNYYAPLRNSTSINMNYRKNKMNYFGNFNYNYREGKSDLELTRKLFEPDGSLNSVAYSTNNFEGRNNNYTLKLGADYYANKKNVFGFVLNGFGFFGRPTPYTNQQFRDPDGNLLSTLVTTTTNKLTFFNYSGNFNYKHTFDSTGREITADFDYVGYSNGSKTMLITDVFDANGGKAGNLTLKGDIPGIINIYSVKSDYTHPLKNDMRFEAGIKISYVKNDNEVKYERLKGGVFVPDDRSNHFIYEENINAAYVSINKKWKKWSTQAGLRLENTIASGKQVLNDSTFTRNYTSLFPTMYLNYEASKAHTLTFSYGRRIGRPNYQDLNPFLWFLDSTSYRQGNPYLTPQYTNNFELRHSYKNGLSTSFNYTVTDDVISQLLKQSFTDQNTFLTTENVAKYKNIGVSINAPIKVGNWYNANVFANFFHNEYKGIYYNSFSGKNDDLSLSYNSFMINVTNTFTFKKGWSAEVSGFYRGKGVEQLSISEPMYFLSLGAQKTVLKGNGTLRMSLRDPFHWQQYRGHTIYSNVDVQVRNKWDNRNLTVTFSYRFGKSSVPQARRRATGANDEQNRAGGQQ
ncbi:MAG: TonB-dependent receptor [Gemmatimonadaceae bacterium]|nr:TonB-dependent receptor [Chitinophagaceae bacterium]